LHGGGFFRGGLDQPEAHDVASALTARGLAVVTVDYRLAPLPGLPALARGPRARRRYPVPDDDVVAVLRSVRAGTDGPVLLGGASAGACLAAAVTRSLPAEHAPDGVVLAYGFFHARTPRDRSITRRVRGHRRVTHHPALLDVANHNHVVGSPSPGGAFAGGQDLSAFPPTLMIDAEHDTMRASGDRFAAELRAAGRVLDRHVLPAARHAFLNRPGTADSDAAIEHMATWSV
jgi:acetyl esterase